MVLVAIGVTAAILSVFVLLALWACLFYKFYWKRRKKLQKKKDEESKGTSTKPGTEKKHNPFGNGEVKTSISDKVLNANQAFNLAYEEDEVPEDIRMAYGAPTSNGHVYKEQHSQDSGSSFSSALEYPYGHSNSTSVSRVSAGSDSEGNRSVRFAQDLPTLRGDEPPGDGRTKIPKTKVGYWVKPPATPRGKKPLPVRYVGSKNPVYNKSSSGRKAQAKDVIAVEVKVPQKTGKRSSRDIQTLQPSDVVIKPLTEFEPTSKSQKLTVNNNNAFPLLQDVQTAGRPPGGNKVVRQRSILKKSKSDIDSINSNISQSQSVSMSSQSGMSGTDNSENEFGSAIVPQTAQRRSKRRRPKSIRNASSANNSANPESVEKEMYKSMDTNIPPIAHSSPQGSPTRYHRKTPENSLDRISNYSAQNSFDGVHDPPVKTAHDYFPRKPPADSLANSSLDEPLPDVANAPKPARRTPRGYVNPYDETSNKRHNRSSSDQESLNYFNNSATLNQLNSVNGPPGPPSEEAVQSRRKRRRKKSTKRSGGEKTQDTPKADSKFDNMAYIDDEAIVAQNPRYGVTVQGSHGSETEL